MAIDYAALDRRRILPHNTMLEHRPKLAAIINQPHITAWLIAPTLLAADNLIIAAHCADNGTLYLYRATYNRADGHDTVITLAEFVGAEIDLAALILIAVSKYRGIIDADLAKYQQGGRPKKCTDDTINEIMRLTSQGLSVAKIALKLKLSTSTINRARKSFREKIGQITDNPKLSEQ